MQSRHTSPGSGYGGGASLCHCNNPAAAPVAPEQGADGSSSDNEHHPPLTLGPPCVRPALQVAVVEVVADKDVFWFCPVSSMDCRGRVSQSQLLRQGQYLHLQLSSAIFGPANILINHLEQIQLNNGINHWIWQCWNHVKHVWQCSNAETTCWILNRFFKKALSSRRRH